MGHGSGSFADDCVVKNCGTDANQCTFEPQKLGSTVMNVRQRKQWRLRSITIADSASMKHCHVANLVRVRGTRGR